jgi:hypothetical protein
MPKIAEIKEIDGGILARIEMVGDTGAITLWSPDEIENHAKEHQTIGAESAEAELAVLRTVNAELAARNAVLEGALHTISGRGNVFDARGTYAAETARIAQAALSTSPQPARDLIAAALKYKAKHGNIYDRQDQEELGDIILELLTAADRYLASMRGGKG